MRFFILLSVLSISFLGCKNNGQKTGQAKSAKTEKPVSNAKNILINANRMPIKPDFRLLEMTNENDVLTVIVQYSGGCEEHDFDAYFSGGWAKSLPPQAAITLEHLNPNKDACRSLVLDTLQFNMKPLQYAGGNEVVVKWSANPEKQTIYRYGK
tara:strand:- start:780 stop:1241 length:462 start_codon:yes stop_codon:yes gene_type:complete